MEPCKQELDATLQQAMLACPYSHVSDRRAWFGALKYVGECMGTGVVHDEVCADCGADTVDVGKLCQNCARAKWGQ